MVANPQLVEDPTPTTAQIQRFFDLIHSGRIDKDIMQTILLQYGSDREPPINHVIVPVQNDTTTDHVIDLDTKPFIPEGWSIRPEDQILSRARGLWAFDPTQVRFFVSQNQRSGRYIQGHRLKEELADISVLPANVLDYLLAHKELIPEYWKRDENGNTRYIFFWGTIYRSGGNLYVRYLYFNRGGWGWGWGYLWLGLDFGSNSPSVVRAE